ncbi:Protein of unknown function [Cotesia congregata]|uniref:Uncharacterized protein n=1 Tax=Cotesia congregata TaxID=51543 RepID=A0A8J2EBK1_COTCN|nr:Protein of unknown function [Cotesia congregata]
MGDKMYPHTGWFTQFDDKECKKEYNYSLCVQDPDYVEWHDRETRPGALENTQVALIYVARPYLTAIDVTERRNLVYNFRSLVARDTKGHLTAGIYFPLKLDDVQNFTIFYQTNNGKKRVKMPFDKFYTPSKVAPNYEDLEAISKCASKLGMSRHELESLLSTLAVVVRDTGFIAQVLAINTRINSLAEDN